MNFSILLISTLLIVVPQLTQSASTYTTKYDNIDLDEILHNQRLYITYFNCLANKGKCTPDGKELKEALPDALKTGCSKCTPKQRAGTEKVAKYVLEKRPADFAAIEKIYDPSGIYRKKYQQDAAKRGIKL